MRGTVALVSLGCAKNLVDSEVMLGLVEEAGMTVVEDVEAADVIIVNTCAFIEPAVEEAIDALLDLSEEACAAGRRVICAGCLTPRYERELPELLPEVDGFMGPGSVDRVVEVVRGALAGERPVVNAPGPYLHAADTPRMRSGCAWQAYVKVAEGCSRRCSFCTIPALRGPYRSRPAEDIRAEVGALIEDSVREICLIAQDTSAWGRDLPGDETPAGLLRGLELDGFDGWLRLQYLHPDGVSDALLEAVADVEAVVPYFDVPLQHADEDMLRRMGRAGGADAYLALTERIRATVPDAALRTTFIVGHPGETPERFERLLEFVKAARFDRLSVFEYWDEEGTASYRQDTKVPRAEARERRDRLMEVQRAISRQINEGLVGRTLRVLAEEPGEEPATVVGRSWRDAPEVDGNVIVEGDGNARPGRFVTARIIAALDYDLRGVEETPTAGRGR